MKPTLILLFVCSAFVCVAQNIEMKKGFFGTRFYSDGRMVKPGEVLEIMRSDDEAYAHFKKAKTNYDVAGVLGFIGGALVGWPIGTAIGGGDPEWGLAAVGGGFIILG